MGRACFCLVLGALALVAGGAFAGEIAVTGVRLHAAREGRTAQTGADVTINDVLVIKDVRMEQVGGRTVLKLPQYVGRNRRVYPQVVLASRQANEAVRQALAVGKPAAQKVSGLSYEVRAFTLFRKRSKLKAFATVSFNDAVDVECKVFVGRNGPWVAWPSVKDRDGRWSKQVEIADKRLRETIEQDLLARYDTALAEEGGDENN